MDRGLEGHPRSVKLGSGDNKMRLYTSIRSKTPAIWRRGLHISSAGLVLFTGSKRRLLSHPDSSAAQAVLVILLRGSGLSIYGPPLWAVPGSPHFYEVHGRGSFLAETDGNPHPELPRRLAHFGSVGGRDSISQIRAPQPLRVPRTLGQFRQECAVPQPTNFVPENSHRLNASITVTSELALAIQQLAASFKRNPPTPQSISEDAGPHGLSVFGTSLGPASHAAPSVLAETLSSVTDASVSRWARPALQLWPL